MGCTVVPALFRHSGSFKVTRKSRPKSEVGMSEQQSHHVNNALGIVMVSSEPLSSGFERLFNVMFMRSHNLILFDATGAIYCVYLKNHIRLHQSYRTFSSKAPTAFCFPLSAVTFFLLSLPFFPLISSSTGADEKAVTLLSSAVAFEPWVTAVLLPWPSAGGTAWLLCMNPMNFWRPLIT